MVVVDDVVTEAIVDTGGARSLIDLRTAQKLNLYI